MAEHGWTVLCVRLIVDRETKQATLVDAADVLLVNAPEDYIAAQIREAVSEDKKGVSIPCVLNLVSWWFRSNPDVPESCKARVLLVAPDGEMLARGDIDVDLSEGTTGYRAVWPLSQFPLTALGRHYFSVQRQKSESASGDDEWQTVAALPLDVRARFVEASSVEPTAEPQQAATGPGPKRKRRARRSKKR